MVGLVLLLLLQVGGSFGAAHAQPERRALDSLAVALLLAGPATLLLLRGHPRLLCAGVGAATAVYLATGYPYGPVFASLVVALVVNVARGHRFVAWLVAGAVVGVDAVARLLGAGPWSWASETAVVAWLTVVLALAEVGRVRVERAATFREAARERTRRQAGEERLRIAQELHDVVAHHLSLINVQAGVALHLADRRPQQVEPALVAIRDASKEALTELRWMVDVLRDGDGPAPRAPAPTLASIDDIVGRSATAGLVVTKSVEGRPRALPASVELAAYRIVQEAITNVVRHSRAGHASVVLGYGAALLTVRVDDDGGTGVRPDGIVQGNGLRGMQERAAALGGRLSVAPSPLGGLRVEARLPTREGP